MIYKVINIFLTLLFALFAYFQINDPDAITWVFLYGFVAIMVGMAVFGRYNLAFLIPGISIFTLYFFYLTPGILDWIASDDNLVGVKMTDDKPYIENTREAFGLFLGLVALLFVLAQQQWSRKIVR
ncbi:transmembrane 220 family protein [Tunicatimonas pelagia]|uniref:transmembrane 220 family protein n=1 Tax=Tunicatimonas pelagia TaxID=931531 RepID=UPI0026661FC4|nr:transmembrane 220 family protein [Tunicatimonas pelagia]WKN46052.1 transmembrane 220 family protein [Tunicatimonas pelagia]